MTITYLELSGDWEDVDVVLGNLIDEDWDSSNTNSKKPEIEYPSSGYGDRSAGPTRKGRKDQVRLKIVNEVNDSDNSDSSKTHNRKVTTVEIAIETDDTTKAESYQREIDRILAEAHPNSSTRILKVDNSNSHILYLSPITPDWIKNVPDVVNHGTVLYAGLIDVEWAFERS